MITEKYRSMERTDHGLSSKEVEGIIRRHITRLLKHCRIAETNRAKAPDLVRVKAEEARINKNRRRHKELVSKLRYSHMPMLNLFSVAL